jgi:hypothetical protein
MKHVLLIALAPFFLLSSCGDSVDDAMFSSDNAKAIVQEFVNALESGNLAGAAKLCATPFSFRGEVWEGSLEENLKARRSDILIALGKATSVEVYSYRDLMAGRWPRARVVPENERSSEARDLGLRDEGFLVLTFEERRPGTEIAVNADSTGTQLRITGVTP